MEHQMPVKITITEGLLNEEAQKQAASQIVESFLKHHGAVGNQVFTRNVTTHIIILPKNRTFSGGKPVEGAWVEWTVPPVAFTDRNVQKGHFADVTQIIHDLSGKKLPKTQIWADAVHAIDGCFNIDGIALNSEEIGAAISA